MKGVSNRLRSAGTTMTTHVTLPVLAIGAAAVSAFGKFDATLRQVGVVTGLTGDKLNDMSKLALQLGRDTSFSAGQAAQAMLALAKGGLTAAQIKAGVLHQTLTLAAAGGISLDQAATAMANSLNAFGLKATDAARVAAALAGGANASTASVDSLTQGLSQVGAGAVNAGLSINETVAALALLDQQGVKGSDAGTSLKTMLASLIPKTDKAAAAMKKYGLSFVNANGSIKDLDQIAQQLKVHLGDKTEAERNAALATIFGSDATRAASALMRGGAKEVNKYKRATEDLGAAERLAKTNTEGQQGAIERMKGSLETAAIIIGQALSPYLLKLAGYIEKVANRFSELNPHVQGIILVVVGLLAVAGPLLLFLAAVTGAIGVLAGVLAGVSLPVIAVIAALVALGLALVYAYRHSAKFRDIVNNAFAQIKAVAIPALHEFQDTVRVTLARIQAFWQAHGAEIMAVVWPVVQFLIRYWTIAAKVIINVLRAVMAVIRGDWGAAWSHLKEAVGQAVDGVIALIQNKWGGRLFAILGGPLGPALVLLVRFWDQITAPIVAAFNFIKVAWQAITAVLATPVSVAVILIKAAWSILAAEFRLLFATMKAVWTIVTAVLSVPIALAVAEIKLYWEALKGNFRILVAVLKTLWGPAIAFMRIAVQAAVAVIKRYWEFIAPPLKSAVAAIRGSWGTIPGVVNRVVDNLRSKWEAFLAFLARIPSKVGSMASAFAGKIRSLVSTVQAEATKIGDAIVDGIVHGIEKGADKVKNAAKNMAKGALDHVKSFIQSKSPSRLFADQVGKPIAEGVALGIGRSSEAAAQAAANMAQRLMDAAEKTQSKFDDRIAHRAESNAKRLAAIAERLAAQFTKITATFDLKDAYRNLNTALGGNGTQSLDSMKKERADVLAEYLKLKAYLNKNDKKLTGAQKKETLDKLTELTNRGNALDVAIASGASATNALNDAYRGLETALNGGTQSLASQQAELAGLQTAYADLKAFLDTNEKKLGAAQKQEILGRLTEITNRENALNTSIAGGTAVEQLAKELAGIGTKFDLQEAWRNLQLALEGNTDAVKAQQDELATTQSKYAELRGFLDRNLSSLSADQTQGILQELTGLVKREAELKLSLSNATEDSWIIPGLAIGGGLAPGQLGLVGERGPEFAIGGARGTTISPTGGGRAGRMSLTITNWEEGTGYIEVVASEAVAADAARSIGRQRMQR